MTTGAKPGAMIAVEECLFYWLLRRAVKRMSISHLKSWIGWFRLDVRMKEQGIEKW